VRYGHNVNPDPLAIVTSKREAFKDKIELRVLCDLGGVAENSPGFFLTCDVGRLAEASF
jgi:hypothetical protein